MRKIKVVSNPSRTCCGLEYHAAPLCELIDAVKRSAGPQGEVALVATGLFEGGDSTMSLFLSPLPASTITTDVGKVVSGYGNGTPPSGCEALEKRPEIGADVTGSPSR